MLVKCKTKHTNTPPEESHPHPGPSLLGSGGIPSLQETPEGRGGGVPSRLPLLTHTQTEIFGFREIKRHAPPRPTRADVQTQTHGETLAQEGVGVAPSHNPIRDSPKNLIFPLIPHRDAHHRPATPPEHPDIPQPPQEGLSPPAPRIRLGLNTRPPSPGSGKAVAGTDKRFCEGTQKSDNP